MIMVTQESLKKLANEEKSVRNTSIWMQADASRRNFRASFLCSESQELAQVLTLAFSFLLGYQAVTIIRPDKNVQSGKLIPGKFQDLDGNFASPCNKIHFKL